MIRSNKLVLIGLSALLLLLAACTNNPARPQSAGRADMLRQDAVRRDGDRQDLAAQQQAVDNHLKARSLLPPHHAGNHDPLAIPSVDRMKTRTTNEFGGTSYGLGSSVYSVIGSSGLHSQGLSSHLESRLSTAGLSDIRVFALDDMVILATNKNQKVAYRYDSLQQKVLGGTSGAAAIGPDTHPGPKIGTIPAGDAATHDNLVQAVRWVRDNMGNVRIYSVTSPEAVRTIDRIRSQAGNATMSSRQVARDIQRLLQLATNSQR